MANINRFFFNFAKIMMDNQGTHKLVFFPRVNHSLCSIIHSHIPFHGGRPLSPHLSTEPLSTLSDSGDATLVIFPYYIWKYGRSKGHDPPFLQDELVLVLLGLEKATRQWGIPELKYIYIQHDKAIPV